MSKHPASVFDQMINDILNIPLGGQMLEECMPAGPSRRGAASRTKIMQKVPLRYRLIALGFIKKESLSQLNEKLSQEGCAQLYSRSLSGSQPDFRVPKPSLLPRVERAPGHMQLHPGYEPI